VRPPKEMPPHTMTDPPPNRSCWRMLQAAECSPWCLQTVTSVTCAQCEPAFICEEHRAPVANLPVLGFSGKCQTSCMVLGCKHNPHLLTSGLHNVIVQLKYYRSFRLQNIPRIEYKHCLTYFYERYWYNLNFLSDCFECVWACGLLKKTR
jgi:hypothetical protein